ncbi:MAG: hypothetical protein KIT08_09635 [Anaerolineales bacterium]|nr:MAG: hypothetical protein KIT08_09635 [Anaerolineales bacterium]
MNERKFLFWRWIALLFTLLLVPALCVAAAFASNLQITSPYFSISFGPSQDEGQPPLIVFTGSPNQPPVVNGEPPDGGPSPTTGGPQQPPGNNPAGTSGNSCLLGVLCLSVNAGMGNAQLVNLDLGKATATANPTQTGSMGCLLGLLCITTVQPTAIATQGAGACEGLACVDAGLGTEGGDLSLNVGAELPVVGSQLGVDVDNGENGLELNLQVGNEQGDEGQDLNLNVLDVLQIGVGGGNGGVSIGLGLPSLFP